MLRVAPTDRFLEETKRLSNRAEHGPVAVRCRDDGTRSMLVAGLTEPGSDWVVVRSRSSLDQVERAILDVATALGDEVLGIVDEQLRAEPDVPKAALETLSSRIDGRRVLVDGIDELRSRGPDPELGQTLAARRSAVAEWLERHGRVFLSSRLTLTTKDIAVPFDLEDVVTLHDGAPQAGPWDAEAEDRGLWLASYLLGAREGSVELPSSDDLRSQIDGLLPRSTRGLLRALALHARPLPRSAAEQLADARAIASGIRLGLVHETPAGFVADGGWTAWAWHGLERPIRQRVHLELAQWFARSSHDQLHRGGLHVLEAHRHFLAAGEVEQAQGFVRYGVALMIDQARRLSRSGRYGPAGRLYETVLVGAHREGWPIGSKLRGYATHYLHFNRARDERESFEATEAGYRAALEDWPGNALFWSRLVRTQCYVGRRAAALSTLERAEHEVSPYPLKETVLVARTVRGLLRRAKAEEKNERLVDALVVWGDYRPDSETAEEVAHDLRRQLDSGWMSSRLTVGRDAGPLVFTRELLVRIEQLSADWLASVRELEVWGRGSSPLDALAALTTCIGQEAEQLLHAFTHELDAVKRLRKRRLLGAIDVIASRLDAAGEPFTWVFGDLEHREGRSWLRTGGSLDLSFEIPESVAQAGLRRDRPYFARVATGPSGHPSGPVLELEPGTGRTEDEVWEEWRRRLAGG